VLLDCDPAGDVGTPPGSSFDVAVRAAGSILQTHAARGRTSTLVSTGTGGSAVQVRSAHAEFGAAVATLAAAIADAPRGLPRALGELQPRAGVGELTIVTATRDPAAFAGVLTLATRRPVSLVWVDAASFAGRPNRAEPGVLRLAAHGVPTAVVRRGDHLAAALSPHVLGAAARG
jgi:uncharacterized protein (DUF58 family)